MNRLCLIAICSLTYIVTTAQSPYDISTINDTIRPDSSKTSVHIDITQFFINNEYFNPIVEGYTLPGTNLKTGLSINPSQKTNIYAGLAAIKYFGEDNFETIKPEANIQIQPNNRNVITIGSLQSIPEKNLLPQLYNPEQQFTKTQNEGISYSTFHKRIKNTIWVSWLDFLHPNEHAQEKIFLGNVSEFTLIDKTNIKITLPIQFTAYHIGGQINDTWMPMYLFLNNASGIKFFVGRNRNFLLQYYYVGYKDNSSNNKYFFKNGDGHILSTEFNNNIIQANINFWIENQFISPFGEAIFQSQSQRIPLETPATHQKNRQIVTVRLFYKHNFTQSLCLLTGAQVYSDIKNNITDYSYAIIVRYSDLFRLMK